MTHALSIGLSNGASDLDGILALQRANLRSRVSAETAAAAGFVTVAHTRDVLARMHDEAPSIVATEDGEVVAYALTMLPACRAWVPELVPMFTLLDQQSHEGRKLSDWRYYTMGQVCVAESHRGRGLFDALYAAHRAEFADRYDLLITEISTANARSLRAHERVGFRTLSTFRDQTDEWRVVVLALNAQGAQLGQP